MTTVPPGQYVRVSDTTAKMIVGILLTSCEGPADAFATMVVAFRMLADINDEKPSNDQLAAEFAQAITTMQKADLQ